jgi:transcriptional regulator with XRE-family HTH domain
MANGITNDQKREWAKMLFTRERLTQKEIAERVGVSAVTISKWVQKHGWDSLKLNLLQSREERVVSTLQQLQKLDDAIADGTGFPDSKQADIRRKLTADLEALEQEVSVRDKCNVGRSFINWLKEIDESPARDKTREVARLFDMFIRDSYNGKTT